MSIRNNYSDRHKLAKLLKLAEYEGCSWEQLCERATFDSVAASICINPDCDYTVEMEPDQEQGYCEVCDAGTVMSCLVLAGII